MLRKEIFVLIYKHYVIF